MELTVNQTLTEANASFNQGKLQEAERLYRAILQVQPKHPDANYNLGLIAVSMDQSAVALPLFKSAIGANPNIEQYWLSYIEALITERQFEDAKQALKKGKRKGVTNEKLKALKQKLVSVKAGGNPAQVPFQADLQKLIDHYRNGRYEDAERLALSITKQFPNHPSSYNVLGGVYRQTGRPSELVIVSKKVVALAPEDAEAHSNLGLSLKELGRFEEAALNYERALELKPDFVEGYTGLGNVLTELGRLTEAEDSYKRATALKPDFAEAYSNLGNTQRELDKLEEAEANCKKAITLKPDFAEAYNNLGITLQQLGKLEEAEICCRKAIVLKPDLTTAYLNMGVILMGKGDLGAAINSFIEALKIKPDNPGAYANLAIALSGTVFIEPNPDIREIITSILDHKTYVRPRDISKATISLLKLEPVIKTVSNMHSAEELRLSLQTAISGLSQIPLLLKFMSVCPIADLELEALLTDIRSALLASISEITGSSEFLRFQSALALQCFTNEYVYVQTYKETKALETLEIVVKESLLKRAQPSPQAIFCLAAYKALHDYEWSDLLTVTADIEDVFTRQVIEPKQETSLKSDIPILQEITDKVSSKVREQYETNPYPRWVSLGLPLKPASVSLLAKRLELRVFDPEINDVANPNILIAGCGTGQQSIGTAARFKNSTVLAVDISLASLAYAKRRTQELSFRNIDYMQADILGLGKLERQFDIVASSGVLHHMDDPMAGWKVLTDCLKPGGLMKIGLYSELARQGITKMREEIDLSGIGSSDDAIRIFRTKVINSDEDSHKSILKISDFYSLSELRDLLFHVQEHRFTLPEIQGCLSDLGLKFCGFSSENIVRNFNLTNTAPDDLYDLGKWHAYEDANPNTFIAMYQFWCQKVA